jgi:hypothetical protein
MDVVDRFEVEICDAIRRRQAAFPAPRRRAWRRGPAVLAAAVLLGAGGAVAATQLVGSHAVKPKTPSVSASEHFAIFREAATSDDALKFGAGEESPNDVPAGAKTRLAFASGATKVYAIDTREGRLCLLYRDSALGTSTCVSTKQAIEAVLPLELTLNRTGGANAYLAFPDEVTAVVVTTASGEDRTLEVRRNFVALPRGAQAVRWHDPSGAGQELTNLSPALPAPG